MIVRARPLWKTPGPQPNGLQAATDGLWVIDQADDRVYKLDYEDGSVMLSFETRANHSSGITEEPGGRTVWVASTFTLEYLRYDAETGELLAAIPVPGKPKSGSHGLEWREGTLWSAVPPLGAIVQLDPEDGSVLHSIPVPQCVQDEPGPGSAMGSRPHGLAWGSDEMLWCQETNHQTVYKLNPRDGQVMDRIEVPNLELHGMANRDGVLWGCDATNRQVFVLEGIVV
jgi:sugar lactone lactonase YvrE